MMVYTAVFNTSYAGIKAKSVWWKSNYNTLSSKDLFGNKISFVCGRGTYDIYISTAEKTSRKGHKTIVTMWANRDRRVEFRANVINTKLLRMSFYDSPATRDLIADLKGRYDLSVYVEGSRKNTIIQFALDGFAEDYDALCS